MFTRYHGHPKLRTADQVTRTHFRAAHAETLQCGNNGADIGAFRFSGT